MLISRFASQQTYLVLFFICFCIITSPSLISTIIIGNKAERICPKQTEFGQDLLRVTDWICMRWSVSITVQVWRSDRSGRGNQGIPHYHRVPLGPRVFRLTGDDLIKHNIEAPGLHSWCHTRCIAHIWWSIRWRLESEIKFFLWFSS